MGRTCSFGFIRASVLLLKQQTAGRDGAVPWAAGTWAARGAGTGPHVPPHLPGKLVCKAQGSAGGGCKLVRLKPQFPWEGWGGVCAKCTPPPSYPSAHSEAPVKPQIENTGRRERVLPSAQMDAKFLCPHKLGPAPAADSGSSGPHSTGKAEPGSGKALAVRGGSIQF